jgi:hypothetical protein
MNFKETRFAYRHIPTLKWVEFSSEYVEKIDNYVRIITLVDDLEFATKYKARNCIQNDLASSYWDGERHALKHPEEFELLELEVEYRIKNHANQ